MKKILSAIIAFTFVAATVSSFSFSKKKVVIDAGHGGNDHGATYNNYSEKEVALAIAKQIKSINKNENLEIILSRDGDTAPTLSERVTFINAKNPDLVLSLHVNRDTQKDTRKNGMEVYYSSTNKNAEASKAIANKFASNFGSKVVGDKNLHILRNSNSPALIVELGFLNNENDRKQLTDITYQRETAEKILKFLNEL